MSQSHAKTPLWFWVVAGLAVVWNIIGVLSFIGHVTISAEALAEMEAAERALFENAPAWSTASFAIAVSTGLIGSVLLVLRKSLAFPVFVVSLVAVIIQFTYWLFMTNSPEVYGGQAYTMPAMVTVIAIALVWFSNFAKAKSWLN